MRKFIQTLSIVLLVCCSLLIFTGCGSNDDSNTIEVKDITYNEYVEYLTNPLVTKTFSGNFKHTYSENQDNDNFTVSSISNNTGTSAYFTIKGLFNNTALDCEVYLYQNKLYVKSVNGTATQKYYVDYNMSAGDLSDELSYICGFVNMCTNNEDIICIETTIENRSNMLYQNVINGEDMKYIAINRITKTTGSLTSEELVTETIHLNKHKLTKYTIVAKNVLSGVENTIGSQTYEATTQQVPTPAISEYVSFSTLA